MRVSQLDSHILDQEIFSLLSTNIDSALSLFQRTNTLSTVSKTLLRAVIWKLGIWDHGTTYGASMQQLRYFNLTPPKKLVLGLITVLGPLIQEKIGDELTPRVRRVVSKLEAAYEILAMLNFVSFIAGSRYDSLVHRLMGISLRPTSQLYRAVSFEFLNRQLVWSQFTEFLLVFLPLLNLPRLRQRLGKYFPKPQAQHLGFLPLRKCAVCYLDGLEDADIVVPYEAVECGHVFCYGCVVGQIKIAEGEGWPCVRCGTLVKSARPYVEVDSAGPSLSDQRRIEDSSDLDEDEDEDEDEEGGEADASDDDESVDMDSDAESEGSIKADDEEREE